MRFDPKKPQFSTIEVDPATLDLLDISSVEVRNEASDEDLKSILFPISKGDFHTWISFKPNCLSDLHNQLFSFEQKKRPTHIFYYYGNMKNGQTKIIGAATVAEKLSHSFPHSGFPILARCCIHPSFRNYRLYYPIMLHRFHYCLHSFRENLKAIHIGTANPRVYNAIKKNVLGIPFLYLGDEILNQDPNAIVHDYLWLSPKTKEEINLLLRIELKSNPDLRKFTQLISKFLQNEIAAGEFFQLVKLSDKLEKDLNWKLEDHLAFKQICDFAKALPIIPRADLDGISANRFSKRAS